MLNKQHIDHCLGIMFGQLSSAPVTTSDAAFLHLAGADPTTACTAAARTASVNTHRISCE